MGRLDLETVRQLAQSLDWKEVQFNERSRVVGFANGIERVNVYYTTGTVGTCTDHPRLGKTQLFRRNMSLGQLRQIFDNVRSHTGAGYYRKVSFDAPEELPDALSIHSWCCSTNSGMDVLGSGEYSPKEFPIMVLGETFLGIDAAGSSCWGPGIPKLLDNKLRGRQRWLPTVDVVCLGADTDTYFVQFADGSQEWYGLPDDLAQDISESSDRVQTIALGENESYYCQWEDGLCSWRGLPRVLHNKLNGRQKSLPPVRQVHLGDYGEYFVSFTDGDWQYGGGGASGLCSDNIRKIQRNGGRIYDIQLGHDNRFLIRYTE